MKTAEVISHDGKSQKAKAALLRGWLHSWMDMQPNESLSVHHQSNFGSKLRALIGAERRLLHAVLIHVRPRWGKSPSILAPRSLFALFLRPQNAAGFF
jgi:hypothetical protein